MGDKKILVFVNGSVSEKGANVSSGQKVCWEPDESDRKVIITFLKDVPFGDWGSSNEQAGHQVCGTVNPHVGKGKKYKYKASNYGPSSFRVRSNPELIVDGGGSKDKKSPSRKKGKKGAQKSARSRATNKKR